MLSLAPSPKTFGCGHTGERREFPAWVPETAREGVRSPQIVLVIGASVAHLSA